MKVSDYRFQVQFSVINKRGMKREYFTGHATAAYYCNKLLDSNNCPDIWLVDTTTGVTQRWTKEAKENFIYGFTH